MGLDFNFMKEMLPVLLKGTKMTIELTILAVIFGTLLGIILALLKTSKFKPAKWIASIYVWIYRGTPLMLQLFVLYYGLPILIGLTLTPFEAAVIGLSMNSAAYMAEIIRGGILAIDKGQFEAAKSLGFSYGQTMKRIILPQTFRIIIPPVGNEFIAMLKDTSLVSTIAMVELMRSAQQMVATTAKAGEIYLMAACLYLLLTTIFTVVFSVIEKKIEKNK